MRSRSPRCLINPHLPTPVVGRTFELKALTGNGRAPQVLLCVIGGDKERPAVCSPAKGGLVCSECSGDVIDGMILDNSTLYSMQYIESTPVVKLYTFTVAENVLAELEKVMDRLMEVYVDRRFKSLEILETLT